MTRRWPFFLAAWLWAGQAAAAGEAQSFALKSEVLLNGPWIRIGDVLDPPPEGKLAALRIKRLGLPGTQARISRDLVALKARDARLGFRVEVSGTACAVTASKRVVAGADIKAFGEQYLRERLTALSGAAEVDIRATSEPRDLSVPDRPVRFEIPPRGGGGLRGNVMLRVGLKQTAEDGSEIEVGQAVLPFMVKVKQSLLAARRDIRRGEVIGQDNTALVETDASYLQGGGYPALGEAEGLKARTVIAAGKVIEPSMLERPPLVKRGDIVKLVVRSGMVAVETNARALRDGAAGDSIPVEIVDRKKQVQARVAEAGLVISESR